MDVQNEREIIKKILNFKKIKNILLCECFWKMVKKEIKFYIKINEVFAWDIFIE